jgi:hypothetical protein
VAIDMIGEERSNHLVVEVLGVDVTALHSSAQVTQRPERTRHASRLVAQLKQPCAVAVHVRTQPPRPPARSRHDRSSRSKRAVPNPSEVIRRAAKLCRPSPMRPRRRAAPGFERTTTINLVRRHGRSGHQPAVFTPIACQCRRTPTSIVPPIPRIRRAGKVSLEQSLPGSLEQEQELVRLRHTRAGCVGVWAGFSRGGTRVSCVVGNSPFRCVTGRLRDHENHAEPTRRSKCRTVGLGRSRLVAPAPRGSHDPTLTAARDPVSVSREGLCACS